MVLHGKKWHPSSTQTLDGFVVEVQMRQFRTALQRFGFHREPMILRSYFHPARPQIHHRMIRAMMTEVELVGFATQRQSQQLMTKTDPEYRFLSEHVRDGSVSVRQRCRIRWSV